jgi:hypothetical protein
VKFAYVDQPYLRKCSAYGHDHPDGSRPFDGRCWDDIETHRLLIDWLCVEFPDGWAMSLSTPTLRDILPLCPAKTRVMAWCKSWVSYKPGVNPAYAWEPVPMVGGRKHGRHHSTVSDFFLAPSTFGRNFEGAKPEALIWWVLACLNVQRDDEFVDLFTGSGAGGRAWERWRAQSPLGLETA